MTISSSPSGSGSVDWGQEVALFYKTVVDLNSLARSSSDAARSQLTKLAADIKKLPLSIEAINVGYQPPTYWGGGQVGFERPAEPSLGAPGIALTAPSAVTPFTTTLTTAALDTTGAPSSSMTEWSPEKPASLDALEMVVPVINPQELTSTWSFSEPSYGGTLSTLITRTLENVLGGERSIAQEYWNSMWESMIGNLGKSRRDQQRLARNRGAASHWGLPTETALVGARVAADESHRAAQEAWLKLAQTEATMAHDDFWKAMGYIVQYEGMLMDAHQKMAARSLSSTEQLHNLRVQVYNANLKKYELYLERGKLLGVKDELTIKRYAEKLAAASVEIQQEAQRVARYQAQWAAYQTSKSAAVSVAGGQVQKYNAELDTWMRKEAAKIANTEATAKAYSAQVQKISDIAQATATLLQARSAVGKLDIDATVAQLETEKARNATNIEVAKLVQAAQEVKAKIDVAQAQWVTGQSTAVGQRLAELAVGFAQACVQASDISYGRNVNSEASIRASQNEELAW